MAGPSVTLRQGTFLGADLKRSLPQILEQFLGVPYGLSTAGEGRFRPPLPVLPSKSTFYATKFGQRCPSGMPDGIPMGEDCLNANIYRPKERPVGKRLPVVIHFHGGSFNFGCGPARDIPSLVAWSTEPILGVTFNYRLGAFGFLPIEGALNLGLKDQALLLQWVQENIAEFGGDPDNVTLMGVSAGAHSIGHHVMHQKSPSLFHKAIMESGATTARAVYPHTNLLHVNQLRTFTRYAGLGSVPSSDLLTALRSLSQEAIKVASETTFATYNAAVLWPFQPVIDGPGGIIPVAPIKAWEAGDWARIPILTGFNTNEGAAFVPPLICSSAQFTHFFRTLLPSLSEDDLKQLDTVYPDPDTDPTSKYKESRPGLGSQFFRLEQAYGQFAYVAPVRQTASFASKKSTPESPLYLYHFAVNCSVNGGANHGDHCEFATYSRVSGSGIEAISRAMHDYWTSFIVTGNPNLIAGRYEDRAVWPAYEDGEHARKIVFGKGNDVLAGGGDEGETVIIEDDTWADEECEYWWRRTELFER
ncbi:extracellular lipase [Phlyctema vagabunda]|uniref:Carboxylic ester hydrolase n=1 Tax=Phlyctema vagabunda TaxID=108571 RepID=A0ABR4PGU7_9HELO